MKRNKILIAVIVIVIILVAVRIALPHITRNYINHELNEIEGYNGSVEEVSMTLYRGAFQVGGLVIYEEESTDPDIPFVILPELDVSIDWSALFRGKLVTEIFMDSLEVNFTRLDDAEPRERFADQIQELSPFDINILEITNATIAYRDPTAEPRIDVFFDNFNLTGKNLSNVVAEDAELPASISVNSRAMGEGRMNIVLGVNILKEIPDFDLTVSFEDINLVKFNDFVEAYADLELESGILSVYSETVAKDGEVTGYVKPVIEDFEIDQNGDEDILQQIYEAVADVAASVLESPDEDRIASRTEISGSLEDIEASIWQTVFSLLRNAFIEAYTKEIENVIHFGEEE